MLLVLLLLLFLVSVSVTVTVTVAQQQLQSLSPKLLVQFPKVFASYIRSSELYTRKTPAPHSTSAPHTPGMHWNPPPPLQDTQPMPSHCVPDAKCQLRWHFVTDSNTPQLLWQPPPTAHLTASEGPSLRTHPPPPPAQTPQSLNCAQELMGPSEAMDMVHRRLPLLCAREATLREAHAMVVQHFGAQRGPRMLLRQPSLLCYRAATLEGKIEAAVAAAGPEEGGRALERLAETPGLLTTSVRALRRAFEE